MSHAHFCDCESCMGGGVVRGMGSLICRRGHEWNEANTYTHRDGRRRCRKCNVIAVLKSRARRRQRSESEQAA